MQTTSPTGPPPVNPGTFQPNSSKWPKTIGILAIVMALIGLTGGLFRLLSAVLQKVQLENLVKMKLADATAVHSFIAQWIPLQTGFGVVMGAIAILLLLGGILLLKRRKVSVTIIRVWAIAYLIGGFYFLIRSLPLVSRQMELVMTPAMQGKGDALQMRPLMEGVAIGAKIGVGLALVWVLVCSLFFLIWFGRRRIREETKTWN